MSYMRLRLGKHWHDSDKISVRGAAFEGNSLLKERSLAAYLGSAKNIEEFISRVKGLNGFFAVVKDSGGSFYAAVDRVRSYPLFYSKKKGVLYISDDPYWIQEELGGIEFDKIAAAEMLLAGYVVGPNTLDPRIKQLQAGEILIAKNMGSEISVETKTYYRYFHHDILPADLDELSKMHAASIYEAVKRLINYANGRLIAIPLSGELIRA